MTTQYVNTRQICKYQTGKNLIEFNDRMSQADAENAGHIHSRYSKIKVVGKDYSKGTGEKAVDVELNLDPSTVKTLVEMVFSGERINFKEQKILAHKKDDDGYSKVTNINMYYNDKMRLPWNIVLENGRGIAETQKTGGTAMKKGSYKKDQEVKIFMDDMSFKKMLKQLMDYIHYFELTAYARLMKERSALEEKFKKQNEEKAS